MAKLLNFLELWFPHLGRGRFEEEEEGVTEDEMARWHHRLNGHEFEQTPGDSEGQGNLTSMRSQRVGHD